MLLKRIRTQWSENQNEKSFIELWERRNDENY